MIKTVFKDGNVVVKCDSSDDSICIFQANDYVEISLTNFAKMGKAVLAFFQQRGNA